MNRVLQVVLAFLCSLPALAEVSIQIATPLEMDAQNRIAWHVTVSNPTAVSGATMIISSGAEEIVGVPAECVQNFRTRIDCTFDLGAATTREFVVVTQAFRRYGHNSLHASSGALQSVYVDAIFAHEYLVTNTNDAGAGSLRQALLDINRTCPSAEPCAPVFHIEGPVPAEGYFTIRPLTPLPLIRGDVFIDGRTQSRFTSDTNPSGGPEIFLDGSLVSEGHGLVSGPARLRIADIAIGNFPGNGIEMGPDGLIEVYRSWLGVDPTGVRAAPNGLRGIQIDRSSAEIIGNVLSGNKRAGGFFVIGNFRMQRVMNNLVGVGADGVTPVGNGASGLFFHKSDGGNTYAEATGNTIANNAHAGIAFSLDANGDFGANSFGVNGGEPIDIALDGPTRDMRPGRPGKGGVIGAPTILSATYENGATIVRGRVAPTPDSTPFDLRVHLYADGELVAKVMRVDKEFVATIDRDLRGRNLRASTYSSFIFDWDSVARGTSELSDFVPVF